MNTFIFSEQCQTNQVLKVSAFQGSEILLVI